MEHLTLHWFNTGDSFMTLRLGPFEVIHYLTAHPNPRSFWRHPQGGTWKLGRWLLIIHIRSFGQV